MFDAVVDEERLHPLYVATRDRAASEAARWMLDDAFQSFDDRDGNFLEQFQTSGFDQRFFELYLHAYFERSGILLPGKEAVPDFFVTGGEYAPRIAVEATTVNPSRSGVLAQLGRAIADLNEDEMRAYRRHELALRYGSPLYSKLQKKYWELPQCAGLPLVFAIQAFHDQDSLGLADSALTSYLFGLDSSATRAADGSLVVEFNRIESHRLGEKEIPSSFFDQPNAEHISAVLFTNSGTHGKFTRMGFQSGAANDRLVVLRRGYALNEAAHATDPVFFHYSLDDPPLLEKWGQGAVVIHNPRALHPIPLGALPDASEAVLLEDGIHHFVRDWHPFTSHTVTLDLGEAKEKFLDFPGRSPQIAIGAIAAGEFMERLGSSLNLGEGMIAEAWYTDGGEFFFGVLLARPSEGTWGYNLFARDQYFKLWNIHTVGGLENRRTALDHLCDRIAERLRHPQRIFPRAVGVGEGGLEDAD